MTLPEPYYEDAHCQIFHGDCLEILPVLRTEYSVVCLDPPYSMTPNGVRGKDDGAAGSNGSPVMLLNETLRHTRRLLIPGGIAPTIVDWRRMADVLYLATLTGLRASTTVAWTRKRVGTGGLFRSAWDPIVVFSNGTPNAIDRAAIPNVVTADYPTKRVHPYEKPPEIWSHVIQRVEHGIVLDPFCGVGASGVAARANGMKWVGIETDEEYCEAAALRMGQEVLF